MDAYGSASPLSFFTAPVIRPAKAETIKKMMEVVSKNFLIQLYCTKIAAKCYSKVPVKIFREDLTGCPIANSPLLFGLPGPPPFVCGQYWLPQLRQRFRKMACS